MADCRICLRLEAALLSVLVKRLCLPEGICSYMSVNSVSTRQSWCVCVASDWCRPLMEPKLRLTVLLSQCVTCVTVSPTDLIVSHVHVEKSWFTCLWTPDRLLLRCTSIQMPSLVNCTDETRVHLCHSFLWLLHPNWVCEGTLKWSLSGAVELNTSVCVSMATLVVRVITEDGRVICL